MFFHRRVEWFRIMINDGKTCSSCQIEIRRSSVFLIEAASPRRLSVTCIHSKQAFTFGLFLSTYRKMISLFGGTIVAKKPVSASRRMYFWFWCLKNSYSPKNVGLKILKTINYPGKSSPTVHQDLNAMSWAISSKLRRLANNLVVEVVRPCREMQRFPRLKLSYFEISLNNNFEVQCMVLFLDSAFPRKALQMTKHQTWQKTARFWALQKVIADSSANSELREILKTFSFRRDPSKRQSKIVRFYDVLYFRFFYCRFWNPTKPKIWYFDV